MASLIRWTWVWASSGSWWWTSKPGMLRSMRLQRVRQDWATELKKVVMFKQILIPPPTTPENYSSKDLDYQQWASLRCSNPKLESLFYSSFFCILSLQAISSSYHLWSLSPGGPVLTTSAVTAWGWQLRPGAALLHFCFWTQQLGSFIIMQIRQVLWLETMNKFPFHLG